MAPALSRGLCGFPENGSQQILLFLESTVNPDHTYDPQKGVVRCQKRLLIIDTKLSWVRLSFTNGCDKWSLFRGGD